MHWILMIYMAGGYNYNTPATSTAEFATKDACLFAAKAFSDKVRGMDHSPFAIGMTCVPKGENK